MSVLCNWRGYWALCARVDAAKDSCFISGGPWLPSEEAYPTLSRRGKTIVSGTVSPLADVVFYPTVRYYGLKVSVSDFYHTDDQPRLVCYADPRSEDLQSPHNRAIQERHPTPYPCEVLSRDGWEQPGKGEFRKIIHVDDLEKLEGPPPDDVCFPLEHRERIRTRMIRRGRWWTEPYESPDGVERYTDLAEIDLARAQSIYFVGDPWHPYFARLGVAEWRGAALLFTDKVRAMLDTLARPPQHLRLEAAFISMTPQDCAEYLRDLQQVSAELDHPITRVLVNRSSGGHVIDIDHLCSLIETRGMTPR